MDHDQQHPASNGRTGLSLLIPQSSGFSGVVFAGFLSRTQYWSSKAGNWWTITVTPSPINRCDFLYHAFWFDHVGSQLEWSTIIINRCHSRWLFIVDNHNPLLTIIYDSTIIVHHNHQPLTIITTRDYAATIIQHEPSPSTNHRESINEPPMNHQQTTN